MTEAASTRGMVSTERSKFLINVAGIWEPQIL
jgi:hypothetical protein